MAATSNLTRNGIEMPLKTTGEPTEQFMPEEDEDDFDSGSDNYEPESDDEFDDAPMEDDDDLDEDEIKRIFPGEDDDADIEDRDDDEPYEGIRHGDKEEGLVDDNMTGMPVVPSPS